MADVTPPPRRFARLRRTVVVLMARRTPSRPYRVELTGAGVLRRHTYATAQRAIVAARNDALDDTDLYLTTHRRYVVEFRTPEGPWLPEVILDISGAGLEVARTYPAHERLEVAS